MLLCRRCLGHGQKYDNCRNKGDKPNNQTQQINNSHHHEYIYVDEYEASSGKAFFVDAKEQEKEQSIPKKGIVSSILQQTATQEK